MSRIIAVLALVLCALPAWAQPLPAGVDPQNTILIDTRHGRIVFKLRPDLAPKHAERIKLLTREGFYNNVPFHRVMTDFMAQTGDGQNRNGTGRSRHPNVPAEFTSTPFRRGIVGMARAREPDSANSQFFIVLADSFFLNNNYTVIGEVVSGMNVVDKIKKAPAGSQSGAVTDPDIMTKATVAADVK